MKKALIILSVFALAAFTACKKSDNEPEKEKEENPDETKYPGKVSSFDGYEVFYNTDGLLTSYSYHDMQSANQKVTVTLNWEADKMTFHNTSLWGTTNAVYNRNASGYCLESSQDIYNHWQYDSLNRLKTMNQITYYWSGQNIDSLKYYGYTEIYEYTTSLETRDYGRKFIPGLPMLSPYLNRNLKLKTIRLDGNRDTANINYYVYEFNSANRVIKETETVIANGAQTIYTSNFSYYE